MHSAPSVTYPVGRSVWAGALLLGLWLAGLAATATWAWAVPAPGWPQGLALTLAACLGAWAGWHWWCSPGGDLSWEGGTWSRAGVEGMVEVRLDLQRVMLLRWQGAGAAEWFWLERAADPARWNDVRRAVYSRANPDALQRAEPPSATP
jgi:toxin CptA